MIPDRIVDGKAHEPAKQQVVAQLLAQLPLAADRVEHLQQQRPDQLLRRDRVPAARRVDLVEPGVHLGQRLVHHYPNRPQRVIRRHKVVELGHGKQRLLHRVRTSHRCALATVNQPAPTITASSSLVPRISTAC